MDGEVCARGDRESSGSMTCTVHKVRRAPRTVEHMIIDSYMGPAGATSSGTFGPSSMTDASASQKVSPRDAADDDVVESGRTAAGHHDHPVAARCRDLGE